METMGAELKFTIDTLREKYPDNDACLKKLFDLRYGGMKACPRCGVVEPKYFRVKSRKCFQCDDCLNRIFPMAGTPLANSKIPLTKWFHVIFMFASSKNGVSAKEIERQTGLCYDSAWNLGHRVRELMASSDFKLKDIVEVDESLYGGKAHGKRGWGAENKTCLFGMIERNGRVKIQIVPDRTADTLIPIINENVESGITIYSDQYKGYNELRQLGFVHDSVNHSRYQWRKGNCYTNSIEGFWSNLKKSLKGTHTIVSPKHLQNYLNEFCFRHNNRNGVVMFNAILGQVAYC